MLKNVIFAKVDLINIGGGDGNGVGMRQK